PEAFYDAVNLNALAPFLLGRCLAAQKRPGGIVNLLDARIADYDREHASYHLSKRLLFTLTRMMAVEFAPCVRVNGIAPGLILPPEGKDESYLAQLAATNPLNRYGSPDDVAEAVLYLLRSDFVTGQVIFVDGGRHMRGGMYGC
ncbi:MAG TPA: SDR family oxidoreductase, partial [Candidatus Hydrogenedentes bacterium]|nr:SDR family oxidoreductase [Candidatus Hydrogenedentota bacterium]